MATGTSGSTTTNFDLILPGYEDDTDVDDLNENFKTIDGELYDATQAIAQNASAIQTVRDSLVKHHWFTVTLGDTTYNGYYFADYDFTSVTSESRIIGVQIHGSTQNRFAFAVIPTSTSLRVYGLGAGHTIWCCLTYI